MSALEDRIRDALRADAATVRQESIPGTPARPLRPVPGRPGYRRARSRRASVLIPLAAAAAVGVVVAGVTVAAPLLRGSGRPGPGASAPGHLPTPLLRPGDPKPPTRYVGPVPRPVLGNTASRGVPTSASSASAPPQFYVTFAGGPLTVRDTSTGKIVGRVSAPPEGSGFGTVTAPAGDRTFVATVLYSQSHTCTSQLYQFTLNSHGQPGPLTSMHITIPGNFAEIKTLAITPDGRTIAYDSLQCGASQGEIGIINLATRQVKIWTTYGFDFTWALSLSPDGRQLAFSAEDGGAWVLNTSAPAGPVSKRDRTMSRTAGWAMLAADGAKLYTCSVLPHQQMVPSRGSVTYDADSLASGNQQVIASWQNLPDPQCWASVDPSGGYLLVQYPVQAPHDDSDFVRPAILDLRTGAITSVPAPALYGPLDITW